MKRILVAIVALMMVVAISAAASAEDVTLKFKETKYEVVAGYGYGLMAELTVEGEAGELTWTSSDLQIASVNNNGYVSTAGNRIGDVTITVKGSKGGSASTTVSVIDNPVTKIELNQSTWTVNERETIPLRVKEYTYKDSKKDKPRIETIWTSSDPKVVDWVYDEYYGTYRLTGLKEGKATITATVINLDKTTVTAEATVTVQKPKLTSISFARDKYTVKLTNDGRSETLNLLTKPVNVTNYYGDITYTSSDERTATVYGSGSTCSITPYKPGEVTITATYSEDPTITATTVVTIEKVAISKVSLNKTKLTLADNRITLNHSINFRVEPQNAYYDKEATYWESSDNEIISVYSYDGNSVTLMIGEKYGTATITAHVSDGEKEFTASCEVTTVAEKSGINLNLTSKKIYVKKVVDESDKMATFYLEAYSENGDELDANSVKWTSSDKKVAVVNKDGLVKSVGKGNAVITATAPDGSTATCNVTVAMNKKVKKIKGNKQITLRVGGSDNIWYYINTKPSFDTLYNPKFIFKSSNNGIVSVNSDGTLKANGTGTATVIVKAKDGSKKTFKMKVKVIAAVQ
jgi:uncharacterized protein YjdB